VGSRSFSLSSREIARPFPFDLALIIAFSLIAACLMAALAIIDERHFAKSPMNIVARG
jgi:hypothetical protein